MSKPDGTILSFIQGYNREIAQQNEQAKTASQAHAAVMAQAIQALESMKITIAAMLADTHQPTEDSFVLS